MTSPQPRGPGNGEGGGGSRHSSFDKMPYMKRNELKISPALNFASVARSLPPPERRAPSIYGRRQARSPVTAAESICVVTCSRRKLSGGKDLSAENVDLL